VTRRQWTALVDALDLRADMARLEQTVGADFAADEGARFAHRGPVFDLIAGRIGKIAMADLAARFAGTAVCWGEYRTVREALANDPRLSNANPLFASVRHASGDAYLTPGFAGTVMSEPRRPSAPAPLLGAHTDEILSEVLKLNTAEIGNLHDARVVQTSR
jgi:2-methylfumaryl-CoA isomerase